MHDDDDDEADAETEGDISPLLEAAIALHEIYLALTEAGFEEQEALRILAIVVAEQGLGG